MPHLVPHHEEQFLLVELGDGRVPQDDALGVAKAGDIGVQALVSSLLATS